MRTSSTGVQQRQSRLFFWYNLQVLLMQAMASGTGAVTEEENESVAEGELPEEDAQVSGSLNSEIMPRMLYLRCTSTADL